MQVVILAGGLGTGMRALAPAIPKCLIEVAGRPFADLQLGWLSSEGATDVLFSIGYLGDEVRNFVGDGSPGISRCATWTKGPNYGGLLEHCDWVWTSDLLEDRFFVLYGDSYLTVSLDQVAMAHHRGGLPALMTVFRNEGRWEESNTAFDGTLITHYEKHSAAHRPICASSTTACLYCPGRWWSTKSRRTLSATWQICSERSAGRDGWQALRFMIGSMRLDRLGDYENSKDVYTGRFDSGERRHASRTSKPEIHGQLNSL